MVLGALLFGPSQSFAETAPEQLVGPEVQTTGEQRAESETSRGLTALAASATVAWVVLMALLVHQFRRQRQFARDLVQLEQIIGALDEGAERGCSTSSQQTNKSS